MYKKEEFRKIVSLDSYYMALKPNDSGSYHRRGRVLKDLRALLNYVQNVRLQFKFDLSDIDNSLRKKLEDIVRGKKTVKDKDWRAKI